MKVKFLADVNVEKAIVDLIREMGYNIIWIAESNPTMRDNEVLDLAKLSLITSLDLYP